MTEKAHLEEFNTDFCEEHLDKPLLGVFFQKLNKGGCSGDYLEMRFTIEVFGDNDDDPAGGGNRYDAEWVIGLKDAESFISNGTEAFLKKCGQELGVRLKELFDKIAADEAKRRPLTFQFILEEDTCEIFVSTIFIVDDFSRYVVGSAN